MAQSPELAFFNEAQSKIGYNNIPAIELESMRLQLNKLITSLKNLQQQLMLPSVSLPNNNGPVISWTKLSERVEAAVTHLYKIQKNIIQFDSVNVYPNVGKFPVSEEELINVLLRKKNLPEIDELYEDLLKIGDLTINKFQKDNQIVEENRQVLIEKYFTHNDSLVAEKLKALKEVKKDLFGEKSEEEDVEMEASSRIDKDNYVITSDMIPFDIESVFKFMYSGVKKTESKSPSNDAIVL